MSDNPYAPPNDYSPVVEPLTQDEQHRRSHIGHETSVKAIGSLYMLGAVFVTILFPSLHFDGMFYGSNLILSVGAALGATAFGLWKLQPWARWVSSLFSVLGLLAFPVGTVLGPCFLYVLLSRKGTVVFSNEYKRIIAATPHVKY